jgi:NitT/TauT family transport system ATP-binding protein
MFERRESLPTESALSGSTYKLELRNVCKVYTRANSSTEVLRDVSLQVSSNEFICLVGPSGCGKTTLLRIIDGLIPASSGSVVIDGRVVTRPGPDRGFVFQQDSLFPWRSVRGNVQFGLEIQGVGKQEMNRKVQHFIKLVGLEDFQEHYPHELSGGMRQRANLARALAVGPDILLMDEPFAALDAQTREFMQAELLKIWSQEKRTVVFITHQIEEACFLADRVVVMGARPGRIKEILEIQIPRPRQLQVKRTPTFIAYVDRIWSHIEQEVKGSFVSVG